MMASDSVMAERLSFWRLAPWGLAMVLLAIPFIAMRFSDEIDWSSGDFILVGLLLALACGAWELSWRARSGWQRAGAAVAIGTGFLTILINLAVGMIGDGPYNLLFGGALLIALAGSALARFRPRGMATAFAIAAIAQFAAAAGGLATDARGGMLSMLFALPWLLAAWLCWLAAKDQKAD
jgi:hypothetical protein